MLSSFSVGHTGGDAIAVNSNVDRWEALPSFLNASGEIVRHEVSYRALDVTSPKGVHEGCEEWSTSWGGDVNITVHSNDVDVSLSVAVRQTERGVVERQDSRSSSIFERAP